MFSHARFGGFVLAAALSSALECMITLGAVQYGPSTTTRRFWPLIREEMPEAPEQPLAFAVYDPVSQFLTLKSGANFRS